MINLQVKADSFNSERESYKNLISKLINQNMQELDDELNEQQVDDGISKLELHIMKQRKRIIIMKFDHDKMNTEKEILEQNMKSANEIVRNLERHSNEYNNELTNAKDEILKLRNEKDKYQDRLQFMWDRLDFQQIIHHKVVTNNPTLEQVIKVYKDELLKLKTFLTFNCKSTTTILKIETAFS